MKKCFVNTNNKAQFNILNDILTNANPSSDLILMENGQGVDSLNHNYIILESYEELALLRESGALSNQNTTYILNNSIPLWNRHTANIFKELGLKDYYFINSYELTEHESKELKSSINIPQIIPIYGHIPLMITANCIRKTTGECPLENPTNDYPTGIARQKSIVHIKDRKGIDFPVFIDCTNCRNIIYNSVPLSLHNAIKKRRIDSDANLYINFTVENPQIVGSVFSFFLNLFESVLSTQPPQGMPEFPLKHFTTGHFTKPVL